MIFAASKTMVGIIEFLLDHKADFCAKNMYGKLAMHLFI
jgi:hypothetical protein